MVEFGFLPIVLVMTVGAFGTQSALVHVVLAMTNAALDRRISVLFARHVALFTLQ
jgi:hypothetical protein